MPKRLTDIVLDARMSGFHYTGIGRYVIHLAAALSACLPASMKMTILSNPALSGSPNLNSLENQMVTVMETPCSVFSLRQQWAIPRMLQHTRAAIYHSPHVFTSYFLGIPTVITIHDVIPLLFPGRVSVKARLFFRIFVSLALRTAIHIITVSETSRQDLLRLFHLSPSKVTAIPLAVDPRLVVQSAEGADALRSKFNIRDPFCLYLGSNKPHKNLNRLIQAWEQIDSTSVQLVIAGKGDAPYPRPLGYVERHQMQEKVKFIGTIEDCDLPVLYTNARCFVFPSLYEGFGLPVLEAMASGTPVACANTPGLKEVADDAALLFDPEDLDDMVRALSRILSDPGLRSDLREKGRHRANQFSWERTAEKTLEIYEKYITTRAVP